MNHPTLLVALIASASLPSLAAPSVGVSISVNQPGVYGRIDIGNMPPPVVVYPQPVIVAPSPVAVYQQPIYLYVPQVQQGNWGRYCGRYGACGQPVYFVRETWVREQHRHDDEHEQWRDNRRRDGRDHGEHRGERRRGGDDHHDD